MQPFTNTSKKNLENSLSTKFLHWCYVVDNSYDMCIPKELVKRMSDFNYWASLPETERHKVYL